jgi:hypothetical protein
MTGFLPMRSPIGPPRIVPAMWFFAAVPSDLLSAAHGRCEIVKHAEPAECSFKGLREAIDFEGMSSRGTGNVETNVWPLNIGSCEL